MSNNPWFRLYSKIMTDPKIEFLSFEDQRHFVWLLCMKNEGYLDEQYPSKQIREKTIARKLGLQGEAFENAKERLIEVNLIDRNWQPVSAIFPGTMGSLFLQCGILYFSPYGMCSGKVIHRDTAYL